MRSCFGEKNEDDDDRSPSIFVSDPLEQGSSRNVLVYQSGSGYSRGAAPLPLPTLDQPLLTEHSLRAMLQEGNQRSFEEPSRRQFHLWLRLALSRCSHKPSFLYLRFDGNTETDERSRRMSRNMDSGSEDDDSVGARDAKLTRGVDGLRALRQIAGKGQADVAAALKIKQPSVSKIENQADMHISTLRSYVEAVGGELELTVKLPKRPAVRIQTLGEVATAISEKLTARKASLPKAGDRR